MPVLQCPVSQHFPPARLETCSLKLSELQENSQTSNLPCHSRFCMAAESFWSANKHLRATDIWCHHILAARVIWSQNSKAFLLRLESPLTCTKVSCQQVLAGSRT